MLVEGTAEVAARESRTGSIQSFGGVWRLLSWSGTAHSNVALACKKPTFGLALAVGETRHEF